MMMKPLAGEWEVNIDNVVPENLSVDINTNSIGWKKFSLTYISNSGEENIWFGWQTPDAYSGIIPPYSLRGSSSE